MIVMPLITIILRDMLSLQPSFNAVFRWHISSSEIIPSSHRRPPAGITGYLKGWAFCSMLEFIISSSTSAETFIPRLWWHCHWCCLHWPLICQCNPQYSPYLHLYYCNQVWWVVREWHASEHGSLKSRHPVLWNIIVEGLDLLQFLHCLVELDLAAPFDSRSRLSSAHVRCPFIYSKDSSLSKISLLIHER